MNRFVIGAAALVLVPVLSGCSNFYLTAPPEPEPTPAPAPTPVAYPFDAAAGTTTKVAPNDKGIAFNNAPGRPVAFRVAETQDIQFGARTAGDTANATLLLVLQPVNPGAAAPAGAASTLIGGVKDINNPVRLAGVIVPGPAGRVGGGLQDADIQALQAEASRRMIEAVKSWTRINPAYGQTALVAGATAAPTPTATPTPRNNPVASGTATPSPSPTPPPIVDPAQLLDVFQDPRFPVDFDDRPLVQVFFKSAAGGGQIKPGTSLSLNRMLIRSGWAVVDLYSPTSFDQQTWLLDESYARNRKLGLWGMQLNGKTLSLQQRVPSPSTGTGALSRVPVTSNAPVRPGATARPGARPKGPVTSATQSPATLTPTLAPINIPRVVPGSGTSVRRGPSKSAVLPPPSAGAPSAPAAPAGGAPGQPVIGG